ncbi:hypothetical protein GOP47_0009697 [Adiantum capillus-veneris]|uniref:Thaumatin-like protein n=2 Tax=Adiantum capillus-veneris TaxID=13818 RepID=A0A9D4UXB0_ADICA|nr:hypothetical protein GOP47_0009697 [Adiantum capillus-veneris]
MKTLSNTRASLCFLSCCLLLQALTAGTLKAWQVEGTKLEVVNGGMQRVCAKYWVPNEVGGACSELGPGQKWDIGVTQRWRAATVWAIKGGCGGLHCNTGPPTGVTQFEITVGGGWNNDYYDVSTLAGFNVGLSVVPSNPTCPSQTCASQSTCQGFVPAGPDRTKACRFGSSDYTLTFSD